MSHLLVVKLKLSITASNESVSNRYADQVSIGDEVLLERNNKIIPAEVLDVSSFIMQGKIRY